MYSMNAKRLHCSLDQSHKQVRNSAPAGGAISLHIRRYLARRDFRNNIKYGEDVWLFV